MLKSNFKQWLARRSEKTDYPPVLPFATSWRIRENKIKNDYYVYFHKTLDGDIFYVGKGRGKRAWQKSNRSKDWERVSCNGYSIEIYRDKISEAEAISIENSLISSYTGLVNKRIFEQIEFNDYSEHFIYDITSPSHLTRIKGTSNGTREFGRKGHCGAQRVREGGYCVWTVKFKKKNVQIHRIIWQLFYGPIPQGLVVDHIDGNPLNNEISNLRLITQAENRRNTKKSTRNSSGIAGVFLCKTGQHYNRWRAQYHEVDGKRVIKDFSISKLGYNEAFNLACEWRAEQIRLLNEGGAGYTERHGT